MFARRSKIFWGTQAVAETPLLLPSFSSKGFPQAAGIMRLMGEFITSPILVSSYDLYYRNIPKKITFSQLIFLDSGGYEARVEHDLSESYGWPHKPRHWNRRFHESVLNEWQSKWPTIAVTYDSPTQFQTLADQLKAAKRLKSTHTNFIWELLIKPETKKDKYLPLAKIAKNAHHLRDFDVIGMTEKEIDDSLFGAMTKIALLRRAMDSAEVKAPIHIFGSLDPLTTILYFISGAEIFDGLTWLRFGYHEGRTMYHQNYAAFRDYDGIRRKRDAQMYEMWKNNYYYLERLRTQMINFCRTGDFCHFQSVGKIIEEGYQQLQAFVAEGK